LAVVVDGQIAVRRAGALQIDRARAAVRRAARACRSARPRAQVVEQRSRRRGVLDRDRPAAAEPVVCTTYRCHCPVAVQCRRPDPNRAASSWFAATVRAISVRPDRSVVGHRLCRDRYHPTAATGTTSSTAGLRRLIHAPERRPHRPPVQPPLPHMPPAPPAPTPP